MCCCAADGPIAATSPAPSAAWRRRSTRVGCVRCHRKTRPASVSSSGCWRKSGRTRKPSARSWTRRPPGFKTWNASVRLGASNRRPFKNASRDRCICSASTSARSAPRAEQAPLSRPQWPAVLLRRTARPTFGGSFRGTRQRDAHPRLLDSQSALRFLAAPPFLVPRRRRERWRAQRSVATSRPQRTRR